MKYEMLASFDHPIHGRGNAWGPWCVAMGRDVMWSVRVTVDKAFNKLKEPTKRHSAATMPTVQMFSFDAS